MKNTAFGLPLVIFFPSKINKAFLGRFMSVRLECLVSGESHFRGMLSSSYPERSNRLYGMEGIRTGKTGETPNCVIAFHIADNNQGDVVFVTTGGGK